jgi:hypothetical protein
VRSFILPKRLGGRVSGFTASGSIPNTLNERSPAHRAPLSRRLKVVLLDCGAIFHLFFVLLCALGVVTRVRRAILRYPGDRRALWLDLLFTVAWPFPLWYHQVIACLIPLIYAIFPPDVPDRELCLDRDAKRGVAYPTEKAKRPTCSMNETGYFQLYLLAIVQSVCVLIGSWWI